MDVAELRQVVELFAQEGEDALAQFEKDLHTHKNEGGSEAVLARMLQKIRHIKASAAALGFAELAEFTQQLELLLRAIQENSVSSSSQTQTLLFNAQEFIREHLQALRGGKRSPGKGDALIQAMAREREIKKIEPTVKLPRPMTAGDIWFVSDDLRAELFEIPEPAVSAETQDTPPPSPSLTAIQAEIARLTRLAASVNFTSIQNAAAIDSEMPHSGRMKEWSLEGLGEAKTNDEAAQQMGLESSAPPTVKSEEGQPTAPVPASEDVSSSQLKESDEIDSAKAQLQTVNEQPAETNAETTTTPSQPESSLPQSTEEKPECAQSDTPIEDSAEVNVEQPLGKLLPIPLSSIDIAQERIKDLIVLQSILDEHKEIFQTALLQKTVAQLSKVVQDLQTVTGDLRDVAVASRFAGWKECVEELALSQRKDVHLKLSDENTHLDVEQLEQLDEAVLAYLRDTIESRIVHVDESMVAEEPRRYQLNLSAKKKPHATVIEISDNVSATADGSHQLSVQSWTKLKEVVSSVHGSFEISALSDSGTAATITIPLKVEVTEAWVVKLGGERFVIQKSKVAETLLPENADVYVVQGQTQILNLRGMTVPLLSLADLLQKEGNPPPSLDTFCGVALVNLENSRQPFAVVVEEILTQQKIVIRPLGAELQGLPGLAGAAVLGDGKPALILDLTELMNAHRSGFLIRRQGKAA